VAQRVPDADGEHPEADQRDRDAGHVRAGHRDDSGGDGQADQCGQSGDLQRRADQRVRGGRAQARRHRSLRSGGEGAGAGADLGEPAPGGEEHDQRGYGRQQGRRRCGRRAGQCAGDDGHGHEHRCAATDQVGQ
jgi:hypothetical protein